MIMKLQHDTEEPSEQEAEQEPEQYRHHDHHHHHHHEYQYRFQDQFQHQYPFLTGGSWTDSLPHTDHCNLFRNTDYAKTSLGPTSDWDPALRCYVSMLFADSRPACVYWGVEDRIAIYNQEFSLLLGAMHPAFMGMSFYEGFPEIADAVRPVFEASVNTRHSMQLPHSCLFVSRNGFLEETFWINQFIPIPGPNGEIQGTYNTGVESTQHILHERQRLVMDQIAALTLHSVSETLAKMMEALRGNPNDVCMALLYTYDDADCLTDHDLHLFGSIGVPSGHQLAPETAQLRTSNAGLVPYFRQAKALGTPVVLQESDGSLFDVAALLNGVEWCGFNEPARNISIQELRSSAGDSLGFYVQGLNPRRPYDVDQRESVADLTRTMEATWMSSVSTEQAQLRERALELRATDSERRLKLMAKHAPIGLVQISMDQTIEWANVSLVFRRNARDSLFHWADQERRINSTTSLATIARNLKCQNFTMPFLQRKGSRWPRPSNPYNMRVWSVRCTNYV